MPEKKAVGGQDWGGLHSVDEDRSLPPWERPSLGSGTGESAAHTQELKARVTPGMSRMVDKLVQGRLIPQIETRSDIVRMGIFWVTWWAVHKGKADKRFADQVDLAMWRAEIDYGKSVYDRTNGLLSEVEAQLDKAQAEGRDELHADLLVGLKENLAKISDKKLKSRAQRIWMEHRSK